MDLSWFIDEIENFVYKHSWGDFIMKRQYFVEIWVLFIEVMDQKFRLISYCHLLTLFIPPNFLGSDLKFMNRAGQIIPVVEKSLLLIGNS